MIQLPAAVALRTLASFGLPGASTEPLAVDSLDQLLHLAHRHRVLPHVYAAVRAGQVANTTDEWTERLRDRTMSAAETTLAAHAAAIQVSGDLRAAGIAGGLLLKGCATAHLDYPRPADRFSSDVDILVPERHLAAVRHTLGDLQMNIARHERWTERFGHADTFYGGYNGVEIDVHIRVFPGYVGLSIPPDQLRSDPDQLEIGGQQFGALDGPNRLIHAAIHARSVDISLHSVRDVAQLTLHTQVDWAEAVQRAERWHIDYFFALGVRTAWGSLDLPEHPLSKWADGHRPIGRQRMVRNVAGIRPRGMVIAGPLALPIRHWIAYGGALAFPRRSFAHQNSRGWRERLRIFRAELRHR